MQFVTIRGLRLYQLYEVLLEVPTTPNAWAVIEESCRMASEEDLLEELYTMLVAAVSKHDLQESRYRHSMFFLYESLCVLLKAVYVLREERTIDRN